MLRRKRKPKHPWRRCELEFCDCRCRHTGEPLPAHIRYLIHERDWHSQFHTTRARRAEELLDAEIEFLTGENPDLEVPEDLEDSQHRTREFWADRIGRVPYGEDYRVASPTSSPLRAPGALR